MSLTIWLMTAPWLGTLLATVAALYYRHEAQVATAAVNDVALVGKTEDAELKAGALVRAKALAQLSLAQQAERAQDVSKVASADAAAVAELLKNGGGSSSSSQGSVSDPGPGASPSGKLGLPHR